MFREDKMGREDWDDGLRKLRDAFVRQHLFDVVGMFGNSRAY